MQHILHGKTLVLTGDPVNCVYTVTAGGESWHMTQRPFVLFADGAKMDFPAAETASCGPTGTGEGIFALYRMTHGDSELTIHTAATLDEMTDELSFALTVTGDAAGEVEHVSFPAPFDFGPACGDTAEATAANLPACYTVLPRMQGTLVPAGQPIADDGEKYASASGIVFERAAYMPMYGQVRRNSGYLAIIDTPYDARYELRGEAVAPLFRPSLGKMAYPRRMLYRFMAGCNYNDFAAGYRAYVKGRGQLVTLREKIARNPAVEKLLGCPVIHENIAIHISPESDYFRPEDPAHNDNFVAFDTRAAQIKELHRKGVKKAYTHFDGWGLHGYDNLHPDPMPPHAAAGGAAGMARLAQAVNGCGYIFGIHDQYRDFYYDSPAFDMEKAVTKANGSHPYCSVWYGGSHSFLCSSFAPGFVRRNYARFEEMGIDVRAAYLDVFSVVELDECFAPDHPATRKQCAENRRECLEVLTDRGIIPSSEEVLDCILPSQVLCHHAPFFTADLGAANSPAVGIPIPLLSLVYHDCVVIPWIGRKGSRGGWGIPADTSGYGWAKLCGGPNYLSITADEQEIAENTALCQMAEKLALVPMLRHEFVSADRRVQRTTFADGTVITVDFDEE